MVGYAYSTCLLDTVTTWERAHGMDDRRTCLVEGPGTAQSIAREVDTQARLLAVCRALPLEFGKAPGPDRLLNQGVKQRRASNGQPCFAPDREARRGYAGQAGNGPLTTDARFFMSDCD